jgi:hypothetical protein
MISFLRLGDYGEMGNQLFQFAAMYSLSVKNNLELKIPIENVYTPNHRNHRLFLYDGFNIPEYFLAEKKIIEPNINKLYKEPFFEYNPQFFDITDGTNVEGFFQSEKYFIDVLDDLLKFLTPKHSIIEYIDTKYSKLLNDSTLSVHFRVGGDRPELPNSFPNVSIEYYDKAIQLQLEKNPDIQNIVVFSDKIEYAKNVFSENNTDLIFIENENHFVDFFLMSMCKHNIVANSTFSWWSAYLNKNKNKTIIVPEKEWFGPELKYNNLKDLFLENWIKL